MAKSSHFVKQTRQRSKREPSFCRRFETEQKRNNQVLRKPAIHEESRILSHFGASAHFPESFPDELAERVGIEPTSACGTDRQRF